MASVVRNQVALCDRNCHKSVEQAITMSGAIPAYLIPSRNRYGIIGPIHPTRMTSEAVRKTVADNALIREGIDPQPVHAIVTNSTYDGLCYNVRRIKELLGESVTVCILTKPGMVMRGSTRFMRTLCHVRRPEGL